MNMKNTSGFDIDEPNYDQLKTKQRATWASGNYAKIGSTLQITGEQLCESMELVAGRRVLDVAAGNGNASLAAARRFCKVLSTDYVSELLKQGQERSIAEGFPIEFKPADAENLPFADHSFDYVLSTFGVMFAPNQTQAASELARVCKSGGKIGTANWTPDSFIGRLFKVISSYIAPPSGIQSPARWGTKEFIDSNFSSCAGHIAIEEKEFVFTYESSAHWLDVFKTYYGPTRKAFEALDEDRQNSLAEDILELIAEFDVSADNTMRVPSRYLEIVITKK
jgi:ubiquinone/menaquinone biosynthesis C-methylase UbiE